MIELYISIIVIFIFLLNKKNGKKEKLNNNLLENFNNPNFIELGNYGASEQNSQQIYQRFITFELINLDVDYNKKKFVIQNGKTVEKEDLTWRNKFLENICEGCSCQKTPSSPSESGDICGIKDNELNECSKVCPNCNKCHNGTNYKELTFIDKCNSIENIDDKKKCEFLKERLVYSKKKCFFTERQINGLEVPKKDRLCDIFIQRQNNLYFINDIIIFRIKLATEIKEIKLDKLVIKKLNSYREAIEVEPIIFFNDKKSVYFFINSKKYKNYLLGKKNKFGATISIKNMRNEIKRFKAELIVSVVEKELNNSIKNLKKETGINYEEEYDDFLTKNNINEGNVKSYLFNDMNNYYLIESKMKTNRIINNYSEYNMLENLKQGKYEYEQKIDNPKTWRNRDDINRPWLLDGSFAFEEIDYDFDMDEREEEQYSYNYIPTPTSMYNSTLFPSPTPSPNPSNL